MQSKTSWINKEMIIHSFRSVGWIALIYLVGLLLALPMRILMIWSSKDDPFNYYNYFDNLLAFSREIQIALVFAIPVLLAIFIFRYLQVKSASDFMHSLPIKRTNLYNSYVGIGVMYLIIPVLITGIILMIMLGVLDLESYYTFKEILVWIGTMLLITILLFISGVFVGTITGLTAVHGAFTYILLLLPVGITILIGMNMSYFLYGFSPNYYISNEIVIYSPLTAFVTNVFDRSGLFSTIEITVYLIATLVLYIAGMELYKRRNLEGVSQPFVMQPLKPFFKYSVTLCVMLLGGMYFSETQRSFSWLIVGYILGSIFGYLIAEMLLQKTWRVFTHLKGYLVFAAIIAIAIVAFRFDFTGYENRMPEAGDVERVFIGNGVWEYQHQDELNSIDRPNYDNPILKNKENIQSVIELHKYLIGSKESFMPSYNNTQNFFIVYELENGEKLIREYRVKETGDLVNHLKPIYESNEYKKKTNHIFDVSSEEVTRISIGSRQDEVIIHEPEKITSALEALKQDVKEAPYDGEKREGPFVPSIRVHLTNSEMNEFYFTFDYSYDRFKKWLESEGLLNKVIVKPEEFEYAVIAPTKGIEFRGDEAGVSNQVLDTPNALKITEDAQLQQTIETVSWGDPANKYFVVMKEKDSEELQLYTFDEPNVPDFVKNHFE